MADAITLQALQDASLDAKSLEEVVNGDDAKQVTTRLGETYPSVKKAIKTLFENGGIAARFKTVEQLQVEGVDLSDGAYALVADDSGDKNGVYIKQGGVWFKSKYDPATVSKAYADTAIGYLKKGGTDFVAATTAFSEQKYYHMTNAAWVALSNSTYFTTGLFDIPPSVDSVKYSLFTGTYIACVLFYDASDNLLLTVAGDGTSNEKTITIPSDAKKVQFTNHKNYNAQPLAGFVYKSVLDDVSLVKDSDLTIVPSANLAKPSTLIKDKYINDTGTITNGAGWVYAKIPVTAGSSYTFGNFSIASNGYYSVHDASGSALLTGSFNNAGIPKTVLIPQGGVTLNIDIARPTNTVSDYEKVVVNEGDTLIDYVSAEDTLTAVKGYKIASSASAGGDVISGGNATFADVIADSITTGALIANLPTSSEGLEVGQAYIDAGTIKVKL